MSKPLNVLALVRPVAEQFSALERGRLASGGSTEATVEVNY